MEIKQSEFITSASSPAGYPQTDFPEIALVGKSNVGKSSFINSISNNHKLARISAQPGKTRLVNFYLLNRNFYIVDLPGYGYAKVAKEEKARWATMIEAYLAQSHKLIHLFHLVDIRHKPTEDDHLMSQWISHFEIPFSLIATKADKISKSQWSGQIKMIRNSLSLASDMDIIPFSMPGRIGQEKVCDKIDMIMQANKEESQSLEQD